MSETKKSVTKMSLAFNPFNTPKKCSLQTGFDKYYYDVEFKDVYKKAGIDSDGEEFGVIETKAIIKKRDIAEYISSQADTVGVEAYMRALAVQGESLEDYNTIVDKNKVVDYSDMPETLADVMTAGDRAKAAFANLDPVLKGGHTTIDGFLNSLTQEAIDKYIKGKVEAAFPVEKTVVKEGE